MKLTRFLSVLAVAGLFTASAQASSFNHVAMNEMLKLSRLQDQVSIASDMIDWKVGEWQSYNMESPFGNGEARKEVTGEEGEGVWMTTTMAIMGQNIDQKVLIRRTDGKILKIIVNGEEQPAPNPEDTEIEILEQREESITVPAGTFDCLYIKVKMIDKAQGQESVTELWMAPKDVNMDGNVKMIAETGFMTITLALKSFGVK